MSNSEVSETFISLHTTFKKLINFLEEIGEGGKKELNDRDGVWCQGLGERQGPVLGPDLISNLR